MLFARIIKGHWVQKNFCYVKIEPTNKKYKVQKITKIDFKYFGARFTKVFKAAILIFDWHW